MTRWTTTVLLALTLTAACATKRPTDTTSTPAWLATLIHELETHPVANPPAFIARY